MDPGQSCRRRHAAHCGRNFGTNEATANNNKPSSSSPLSAAWESSSPALFFRFPAGPHVEALASWLRRDKAALRNGIATAPRGFRLVTDASQAQPAAPGRHGRPSPGCAAGFLGRFSWRRTGFILAPGARMAFRSCERSLEGVRGRRRWAAEESGLARPAWASPALRSVIEGLHLQRFLSSAFHASTAAGTSKRFLTM